jgi:hypothetical protein
MYLPWSKILLSGSCILFHSSRMLNQICDHLCRQHSEEDVLCIQCVYLYISCYLVIACIFKTVVIFSATYTLQQLGRSLQKTASPKFLPRNNTPALEKSTCLWNTSFVHCHFKYKTHSDRQDDAGMEIDISSL